MKKAGWIMTALLLLFLLPASVAPKLMGAEVFTAVLGGTVASHLRAGSPLTGYTLFGVYLGVFLWVALYLRDPAFRNFVRSYWSPASR